MYFCISFRTLFPKGNLQEKMRLHSCLFQMNAIFSKGYFHLSHLSTFSAVSFMIFFLLFQKPLSASASLTAPYLSENKQRPC